VGFADNGDPRYFNRYSYVGNDPINHIDPFGEELRKTEDVIQNDDGTTTTNVDFKFDAAVSINGGDLPDGQSAQGFAENLANGIEDSFTGSVTDKNGNTINYSMDADIRVGDAVGSETSIKFVPFGSKELIGGAGRAKIGNRYNVLISDHAVNNNLRKQGVLGAHEFGHAFGLYHSDGNYNAPTLMKSGNYTIKGVRAGQFGQIRRSAYSGIGP